MAPRVLLPAAREALATLGAQIAVRRREQRRTIADLAERTGVSYSTIQKVERGDPSVAIGTVFDVAAVLGLPLYSHDRDRRRLELDRLNDQLRLLPRHVHPAGDIDDDF